MAYRPLDQINANLAASQSALNQATASSGASAYAAGLNADANRYATDAQLKAAMAQIANQLKVAETGAAAQRYGADKGYQSALAAAAANRYGADQQLKGVSLASENTLKGNMYGADAARQASMYGADQQYRSTQYAQDAETSRANAVLDWQRQRFNNVFGLLNDQMGQVPGGGQSPIPMTPPALPDFAALAAKYAPPTGPLPTPQAGPPVLSEADIQRTINAGVARNDARSARLLASERQKMGGRGFASSSPILAAIEAQMAAGNAAANSDTERQARSEAKQLNAEDALKRYIQDSQGIASRYATDRGNAASMYGTEVGAQMGAYGAQMDLMSKLAAMQVQREQIAAGQRNALLAALAGMA